MNLKKTSLWSIVAGAAILAGCNLYNPNASDTGSSCDAGNAECYIALGQTLIQQKSFTASMNAYEKAISIDSTKSEAYMGYATAATFKYKLNLGSILDDLTKAGSGDPTSFVNHTNQEVTDRILMSTAVVNVLNRLSERDSLTRWYEYLTDSSKATSDPHFAARKAFITHYLDTVTAPTRQASNFPLSDRKKKFENEILQYAPFLMMYTVLNVYNLPPKDIFDDHDRIMINLLSSTNTGGVGDLSSLADSMRSSPVLQGQVNDQILQLQSGLGDVSQLLSYFNVSANADTSGAQAQTKKQMDSAITSLGGSLVFYQFGDKLDNDGDGCIDEEIIDSLDNDLDGFVDEDARLINGTGSSTSPGDLVNNDQSGTVDDFLENLVGSLASLYPGSQPYFLTYVGKYLADHHENEGSSTWIMPGVKGSSSPDIDTRIRIQNDSLAVHLVPGQRPVPAQYATKLDSAKTVIGGCWRNY